MEIAKIQKVTQKPENRRDDNYPEFLKGIKDTFTFSVESGKVPLFNTDIKNIFQVFLVNLPEEARAHYNCHSCARFVNTYGGIVTLLPINPYDSNVVSIIPVMWPTKVPELFQKAVDAVRVYIINNAKITSIFYSSKDVLGTPSNTEYGNEWTHMHVDIPRKELHFIKPPAHKTVNENTAESKELYKMVCSAIEEYKPEHVKTALQLINSKAISGASVAEGQCKWFDNLLTSIADLRSKDRSNVIWNSIGNTIPPNCHIKSSMLGTLLDDIKAGLSVDSIKGKFEDKMDPLIYMRPQADPTTGNAERAEKIFADLGIGQNALERTFATIDDLQCIWKQGKNKEASEKSEGIFDSVKAKAKGSSACTLINWDNALDKGFMTLALFKEEILPYMEELQIQVPPYMGNHISTLLTAADKDSAPILKWDNLEKRNQVSYYVYANSTDIFSSPKHTSAFSLSSDKRYPVSAICYDPELWDSDDIKEGGGINFVIPEAIDNDAFAHGNALFPQDLRHELHEVRNTIENFSADAKIVGDKNNSLCAYRLQNGAQLQTCPRFYAKTTNMGVVKFRIDRWR